MSSNRILKYLIQWFVLVALQVLLLKDFALFNTSYCFAYSAAFLLLPFEVSVVMGMLIAFGTGFIIDVFYDTLGIHTAASVFVAYLRGPLLKALTPPAATKAIWNLPSPAWACSGISFSWGR